jgi:hypothetical protein
LAQKLKSDFAISNPSDIITGILSLNIIEEGNDVTLIAELELNN